MKIKDCPFCDSEVEVFYTKSNRLHFMCKECTCGVQFNTDDEEYAIRLWNRRFTHYKPKRPKYYVYDEYGDEVCNGTSTECAYELGITSTAFYKYARGERQFDYRIEKK